MPPHCHHALTTSPPCARSWVGAAGGPAATLQGRPRAQQGAQAPRWRWRLPWRSPCPSRSQSPGIPRQTGCQPSCREALV